MTNYADLEPFTTSGSLLSKSSKLPCIMKMAANRLSIIIIKTCVDNRAYFLQYTKIQWGNLTALAMQTSPPTKTCHHCTTLLDVINYKGQTMSKHGSYTTYIHIVTDK